MVNISLSLVNLIVSLFVCRWVIRSVELLDVIVVVVLLVVFRKCADEVCWGLQLHYLLFVQLLSLYHVLNLLLVLHQLLLDLVHLVHQVLSNRLPLLLTVSLVLLVVHKHLLQLRWHLQQLLHFVLVHLVQKHQLVDLSHYCFVLLIACLAFNLMMTLGVRSNVVLLLVLNWKSCVLLVLHWLLLKLSVWELSCFLLLWVPSYFLFSPNWVHLFFAFYLFLRVVFVLHINLILYFSLLRLNHGLVLLLFVYFVLLKLVLIKLV